MKISENMNKIKSYDNIPKIQVIVDNKKLIDIIKDKEKESISYYDISIEDENMHESLDKVT